MSIYFSEMKRRIRAQRTVERIIRGAVAIAAVAGGENDDQELDANV